MKLDRVFFKKQLPLLMGVVVVILAVRSSIIEPFRIPTRSMLPGLMMGDFLFVNKMEYGFHFPFSEFWGVKPLYIGKVDSPKRGDIIIFTPPEAGQESLYIKRVVGIPGDKIEFSGKTVIVNGKPLNRVEVTGAEREEIINHRGFDPDDRYDKSKLKLYRESAEGSNDYLIMEDELFEPRREQKDIVIPENNYFVLGDNRDDTRDSRTFGIIPINSVRGRAFVIWFSYRLSVSDANWSFRPERIGKVIR